MSVFKSPAFEVVTVNGVSAGAIGFVHLPMLSMITELKAGLEIAVLLTVLLYNALKLRRAWINHKFRGEPDDGEI